MFQWVCNPLASGASGAKVVQSHYIPQFFFKIPYFCALNCRDYLSCCFHSLCHNINPIIREMVFKVAKHALQFMMVANFPNLIHVGVRYAVGEQFEVNICNYTLIYQERI